MSRRARRRTGRSDIGASRAWAAAGWRKEEEAHTLRAETEADEGDVRKIEWCAVFLRAAGERALTGATAAAAGAETAAGGAASGSAEAGEEGRAMARRTALHWAAWAVGEAKVDETTGEPRVEHREGDDVRGLVQVRARYAQLQRVRGTRGDGMRLEEWTRAHGPWLRAARGGDGGGRWSAHTRLGFRQGAGAARRKETETVAVGPDDSVYAAAQPGAWPWLLEYEAVVRCEADEAVLVRLRLQHGRDETVEVGVSAWPTDARGEPTRSATIERQQVNVALDSGALVAAARELFWVFGWRGAPSANAGMRGALEAAARAAGEGRDWTAVQRVLSGALPRQTMAERVQEKHEREARARRAEEALAAAEAAARATDACRQHMEGGRRREHETNSSTAQGLAGRAVEEAAAALRVEVGATQAVVRKRYLLAALQAHPDKPGGEAARFRAIQEAYEELGRHTPEERRRLVGAAGREAEEAARTATRAAAAACGPGMGAKLAGLEEAEAAAHEAARAAKEAAEAPRAWQLVAERLRAAAAAYFKAWQALQREARRKREREAHEQGYESLAARRATETVQRREQAKAARAAADAAAVETMRAAERRVMERLTWARRAEANELRELSGRLLREAIEADWLTVRGAYRIKVPWAMWCVGRCICKGGGCRCRHRDSQQYETYLLGGPPEGEGENTTVWVERQAATAARVQQAKRQRTWDAFELTWQELAGIERYGRDGMGVRVEPRATDSSDKESASDEEQEQEQAELRRARRRAREATEAAAAAEAAERLQAEHGAEAAALLPRGAEAAAEDARWAEAGEGGENEAEAGGGDGDEGGGRDDGAEVPAGAAPPAGRAAEAGVAAAGRGRQGSQWWREAWMGPVSAAGFADSRGGKGPEAETYSPRTRRAQNAAAHEAEGRARAQGHEAAKVAAAEARRRGERLRLATADAAEVAMEDAGVEQVAEAAGAWRARDGRAAAGARTVLARVAGRAARRLQRERPAASAASKGKRARAMRDVAQLLVAGDAAAERGEGVDAAAADRGCAAVERLLKARLQEHARGQLRAMVNAVLAAQSTRGEEEVSDVEEAGGEPVAEELAPASEEMSDAGEAGGEPVAEELAPAAARSTPSTNEGCMHPLETPELRKRRLAGEPPPRLDGAVRSDGGAVQHGRQRGAEAPGGAGNRAVGTLIVALTLGKQLIFFTTMRFTDQPGVAADAARAARGDHPVELEDADCPAALRAVAGPYLQITNHADQYSMPFVSAAQVSLRFMYLHDPVQRAIRDAAHPSDVQHQPAHPFLATHCHRAGVADGADLRLDRG